MEENKKLLLEKFHKRQEKSYRIGRIFVWVIAVVSAVIQLVSAITDGNWISVFLYVIGGILLILGYNWVRIAYGVINIINAVMSGMLLIVFLPESAIKGDIANPALTVMIIIYAISTAWYIGTSVILFKHKGVKDYMYNANNNV